MGVSAALLSSREELVNEASFEMLSTVITIGWNRTAVTAFIRKYIAVDCNSYEMAPPLRLVDDDVSFEIKLMEQVASNLEEVSLDGKHAFVCSDGVAAAKLSNALRCL